MSHSRPVTRCVCTDRTFAELKEEGLMTLEAIQDRYGCGTYCTSCVPYLYEMIRTGETEFPVFPLTPSEPCDKSHA